MFSKKLVLCFLIILSVFSNLSSQNSQTFCGCEGSECPGGDSPDENYSFSNPLNINIGFVEKGEIVVFREGFFKEALYLLSIFKKGAISWKYEGGYSTDLNEIVPILIISSRGLLGMEESEQFKAVLRDYVENGGFLIVFAQQHGYEFFAIPTPDGRPITGYGWREDLSCQANSVYLSAEHPALSGLIRTTPSIVVDGYFEQIPENSTVLLRRTKKRNALCILLSFRFWLCFCHINV